MWTNNLFVSSTVFFIAIAFSIGLCVGYGVMWRWCSMWKAVRHVAAGGEEMKMALVVRKDLKMGAGKAAAQCAHAAVASVEKIHELGPGHPWFDWFDAWRVTGCSKVVLQCPDEEEMMKIASAAKAKNVPFVVIRDAGRTQIAAGSKTVISVGPGPKSVVDTVTGHLKLY